jgi:hypothetical protein
MRFARDMLTSERDMQHSLRERKNNFRFILVWFLFATFSSPKEKVGLYDNKKYRINNI